MRAWLGDGLPGNGGMLAIHGRAERHCVFARQSVLVKSDENANGLPSILDYSARDRQREGGRDSFCLSEFFRLHSIYPRRQECLRHGLEASGCRIVQTKMRYADALELVVFQSIDAPIGGDVDVTGFH